LPPVATGFIESVQGTALSGQDVLGGCGPGEGLRPGVVLTEVVVDGGLEVIDAGIAAAADAFRRDLGEEPFHEVQP
jgi:hypothetical protein